MKMGHLTYREASDIYLTQWRDSALKAVSKTWKGEGGWARSFCGRVSRQFVPLNGSGSLLFDFRDFHNETAHLTNLGEIAEILWEKTLAVLDTPRERKDGKGSLTLREAFLNLLEKREGLERAEAVPYFEAFIAGQQRGILFERLTYKRLVRLFGAENVRFAPHSDERNDVDLYLFGLPVSVKAAGAYRESAFMDYRYKRGKRKPVLYLSDQLSFAVPDDASKTFEYFGTMVKDTPAVPSPPDALRGNVMLLRAWLKERGVL